MFRNANEILSTDRFDGGAVYPVTGLALAELVMIIQEQHYQLQETKVDPNPRRNWVFNDEFFNETGRWRLR